jgi:hypothetical protein
VESAQIEDKIIQEEERIDPDIEALGAGLLQPFALGLEIGIAEIKRKHQPGLRLAHRRIDPARCHAKRPAVELTLRRFDSRLENLQKALCDPRVPIRKRGQGAAHGSAVKTKPSKTRASLT